MINAVMIDEKDNVSVAIDKIDKGNDISYKLGDNVHTLKSIDNIQIYHKFANKDIKKGEPIVKYGEHIGIAGTDIKAGQHVHTHNVESHRGDL